MGVNDVGQVVHSEVESEFVDCNDFSRYEVHYHYFFHDGYIIS